MSHRYNVPGLRRAAIGVIVLSLSTSPALARGADDFTGSTESPHASSSPEATHTARPSFSPSASHEGGLQSNGRLDAAKLKVCDLHHDHAVDLMKRITDRTTKQLDTFDKIATRVEAFYVAKGHTLSNYDALVANVATTKAAATADLAALKAIGPFDCNAANPMSSVSSFKTAAQKLLTDLKAYRTSIKNLIVGVKSVNEASPSPAASPEGDN